MENSYSTNQDYQYEIQVELWENQRYKPLQGGWGPAFSSSSIPNFSDLMAKVSIHPFNPMEDDGIPLPQGWEWIDDAWQPVISSSYYGEIDEEGWSYASSFDRLIQLSSSRNLQCERSHLNIYRRRRWYRRRQCNDPQLNAFYQERKLWIQSYCVKMMEEANRHTISSQMTLDYHTKWKKALSPLIQSIDNMKTNLLQNFDYLQKNLFSLQSFLMELGLIEQQYASKLQDLSFKWKSPYVLPENEPENKLLNSKNTKEKEMSMTQVRSSNSPNFLNETSNPTKSSNDSQSQTQLEFDSQPQHHPISFFDMISQYHTKLSYRKANLASLIHDSLLHDVMSLIEEVDELFQEYSIESVKNWKNYEEKYSQSEIHCQLLQQRYTQAIVELQEIKRGYIESLGRISIFQNTEEIIPLFNDQIFVSELLTSSAISSTSLSNKKDIEDPWSGLIQYSMDILQVNGHLFILHAFYKSMLSKSYQLLQLSSRFLQSLMKLFVHQQYLLYQEAMNMYQIIGQTTSSTSITSTSIGSTSASTLPQASHHALEDLEDQLGPHSSSSTVIQPPIPIQDMHLHEKISSDTNQPTNDIEEIEDITEFILSKRQDVLSLLAPFKLTLKHIVKYALMDYLLISNHLKLNWNQPLSIFEQSESLKYFQSALIILTYDQKLHLLPLPDILQKQLQSTDTLEITKTLLIQSILSSKEWNPIATFELKTWSTAIEPFYIPQEGYRDALLVATGISPHLSTIQNNSSMINRTKRANNRRPSLSFSTSINSKSSFSENFSLLSSISSNIIQGTGQGIILVSKNHANNTQNNSQNNTQDEILQWIKALLYPYASFDQPMPDLITSRNSRNSSSKKN